jgi:hypothetical protein
MGVSLILYLAGIGAVVATFFPRQRLKGALILLLCVWPLARF